MSDNNYPTLLGEALALLWSMVVCGGEFDRKRAIEFVNKNSSVLSPIDDKYLKVCSAEAEQAKIRQVEYDAKWGVNSKDPLDYCDQMYEEARVNGEI